MAHRKSLFLVAALLSTSALSVPRPVLAQNTAGQILGALEGQNRRDDDDRRNDPNRANQGDQAYQRGQQDGQRDAQNDLRQRRGGDATRNQNYRDAPGWNQGYGDRGQYQSTYRQGYSNAYQQGYGQNGNYGGNGNGQNGTYGQNGYGSNGYDRGQSRANQLAFQNGTRAGQSDAARDIRSNRTNVDYTQSDLYGRAPGWNARMGDRNQYKQAFRQGYQQGYQQAWANVRGNNGYPQRR